MANYVSQVLTPELSSTHITKVSVPSGGLKPGQVVLAHTLQSGIAGNYEVFAATQPATATLNDDNMAIVINGGIETLSDGRRPAGQPDYYQYTFAQGDIADVVYLDKHLKFNISISAITVPVGVTPAAGMFLYATNGSNNLTINAAADVPEGTTKYLKVLALYNTPVGGLFGGQFEPTMVCMVV